jgi:LytS/YehU family sensor histidine kinase
LVIFERPSSDGSVSWSYFSDSSVNVTWNALRNAYDTDEVYIPAMLLQPFIENAIIHGVLPNENKEGLITVDVRVEQNNLLIQIQDNGVGINNSIKLKENDQGDHRSQGMEITTKRIDLIKKISNKGFEIIGPFQMGGIDSEVLGTKVILKIPIESFEN